MLRGIKSRAERPARRERAAEYAAAS
jgi:hypothetical protein